MCASLFSRNEEVTEFTVIGDILPRTLIKVGCDTKQTKTYCSGVCFVAQLNWRAGGCGVKGD